MALRDLKLYCCNFDVFTLEKNHLVYCGQCSVLCMLRQVIVCCWILFANVYFYRYGCLHQLVMHLSKGAVLCRFVKIITSPVLFSCE